MSEPTNESDEPILVDGLCEPTTEQRLQWDAARTRNENAAREAELMELVKIRAENRCLREELALWKPMTPAGAYQAQVARLQAEAGAMLTACKRADKIIFDTYSNAQKLEWKAIEENCLQAIRILNTVTDGVVSYAGSAILRERDDLRDAIRLVISQHTGVPWREVRQADVDGYVEAMRKLKETKE